MAVDDCMQCKSLVIAKCATDLLVLADDNEKNTTLTVASFLPEHQFRAALTLPAPCLLPPKIDFAVFVYMKYNL